MRTVASLRTNERGAALMEFGFVAPIVMVLLMGAYDAAHRFYARSVLQGAVEKAARDTGLEGASSVARQKAVDDAVLAQLKPVNYGATITFERKAYRSFARAASPAEPFSDTNKDGQCNKGEPYEDINNNGARDSDVGVKGQGGAQDAVVYTVHMKYKAVTPVAGVFGLDEKVDLAARTVLRNQPYNEQAVDRPSTVRNCA